MKAFTTIFILQLFANSVFAFLPKTQSEPWGSVSELSLLKPLTQLESFIPQPAQLVKPNSVDLRHADSRKPWGVDNSESDEYWFDERIHTLGNVGFWGGVHAALAPFSTKLIDVLAYDGIDIRAKVAQELSGVVVKSQARVVDLCCGVGFSTRALREAFPDAEEVIGVDTSAQMVSMADFLTQHISLVKPLFRKASMKVSTAYTAVKEQGGKLKHAAQSSCNPAHFIRGNAEHTDLPDNSFDLVTIMYAFHEAPTAGRDKILQEARRLLQPGGMLAVVDISTDYTPSEVMLKGEPYVIEYQENIHDQMGSFEGFSSQGYKTLVPNHVGMWLLERMPATA